MKECLFHAAAYAMQDFGPRTVAMNGSPCAIGLSPNLSAPAVIPGPAESNDLSSFVATGYVNTAGNRIIGVDGQPLTLNGLPMTA